MAIAAEAMEGGEAAAGSAAGTRLTGEHAAEYQRLVSGGAPAGRDTLRKAGANVAAQQGTVQRRLQEVKSNPAKYVAEGGPTGDDLRQAAKRFQSGAGRVYGALPSSGPDPTTRLITRLIWGLAVGLVALEVAAQATGQQWSFSLPGLGRKPKPAEPYVPLAPSATTSALPGVFGTPDMTQQQIRDALLAAQRLKLNPGTAGQ